jgi:hypothetical protein
VSNSITSWFHCGRCGSLFQATVGAVDSRLCTSCGANPSLGIAPPTKPTPPPQAPIPVEIPEPSPASRKRSKSRKPSRNLLITKLVVGWCLFLAAIVFVGRMIWKEDPTERPVQQVDSGPILSDADILLFEKAVPKCHEAFAKFLAAGTPEERNQFVLSPVITASRMARYYALNPVAIIDPSKLASRANAMVHVPGRTLIETQWVSVEGKLLDAVFAEENGEWRLDWDHFIRFGDQSWNSFIAGSGEATGEFRVLAREPLADERKGEKTIRIVLYEPRFGDAEELGKQSPEFTIERDSKDGRLLDAAFHLERTGKNVYDSTLARIDPENLIRLRVKARREKGENGDIFTIDEVTACHWYGIDHPGIP